MRRQSHGRLGRHMDLAHTQKHMLTQSRTQRKFREELVEINIEGTYCALLCCLDHCFGENILWKHPVDAVDYMRPSGFGSIRIWCYHNKNNPACVTLDVCCTPCLSTEAEGWHTTTTTGKVRA